MSDRAWEEIILLFVNNWHFTQLALTQHTALMGHLAPNRKNTSNSLQYLKNVYLFVQSL